MTSELRRLQDASNGFHTGSFLFQRFAMLSLIDLTGSRRWSASTPEGTYVLNPSSSSHQKTASGPCPDMLIAARSFPDTAMTREAGFWAFIHSPRVEARRLAGPRGSLGRPGTVTLGSDTQ